MGPAQGWGVRGADLGPHRACADTSAGLIVVCFFSLFWCRVERRREHLVRANGAPDKAPEVLAAPQEPGGLVNTLARCSAAGRCRCGHPDKKRLLSCPLLCARMRPVKVLCGAAGGAMAIPSKREVYRTAGQPFVCLVGWVGAMWRRRTPWRERKTAQQSKNRCDLCT